MNESDVLWLPIDILVSLAAAGFFFVYMFGHGSAAAWAAIGGLVGFGSVKVVHAIPEFIREMIQIRCRRWPLEI